MSKSLVQLGAELKQDLNRFRQLHKVLLPMVCPTCGYLKSNALDIQAINNIGECLSCDHIRGEIAEENTLGYALKEGVI